MRIVVLGSGRSSWYLLNYLAEKSAEKGWKLLVCDRDEQALQNHTKGLLLETRVCDIANTDVLSELIEGSAIVISLLPPTMHFAVAQLCLKWGVHLATASYVSAEMKNLHSSAAAKGLIFLNEMGLDPGIDHLSAMRAMDAIRSRGAEVVSFESYCGGLIAEANCGDNPWGYKFSWNPRNVVLAGQGGMSIYRQNDVTRCLPWHRLFGQAGRLPIPGLGNFDAYANRDSLGYAEAYGLQKAKTIVRGTLRRSGFCEAWQVLVELGYTDALTILPKSVRSMAALSDALTGKEESTTTADWLLNNQIITAEMKEKFKFLGLDDEQIFAEVETAADILTQQLMKKWKMGEKDRDEVVMYHKIGFEEDGELKTHHSVLRVTGDDALHTAMAKTVGLPLAMGVEMILLGESKELGVVIPVSSGWYVPVLKRLEQHGIVFKESIG